MLTQVMVFIKTLLGLGFIIHTHTYTHTIMSGGARGWYWCEVPCGKELLVCVLSASVCGPCPATGAQITAVSSGSR